MNLLTIDIGNTNLVLGLFTKNKLHHKWRIATNFKNSADDYAIDIVELFLNDRIDCLNIEGCIISSVVPSLTLVIQNAVKKFVHEFAASKTLILDESILNNYIKIAVKNKNDIGHDRLVNAISAIEKFGANLIIIDFGTATTFDVVGSEKEYIGGAICAGVNLSIKALHEMTAQLPKISVKPQTNVIGTNTFEAINSGVFFGHISMIEGMIQRIEKEFGSKMRVVLTGGISAMFHEFITSKDFYEPDLILDGLRMVYQKHYYTNSNLK